MPHLKTLAGLRMAAKYVSNWQSLLPVYSKMKSNTLVRFKDGKNIMLYSHDFLEFYEEIYKRHLKDNGFVYEREQEGLIVKTPKGIKLRLPRLPYSFILDEIFVMKVYGEFDLNGHVVIDIGAGIGDSSIYFSCLGASHVYGFEVENNLCQIAQENLERNNLTDKIKIMNKKATAKVVDSFVAELTSDNIFMKLDCEGCEYEIIHNMNGNTIRSLSDIVLEHHNNLRPIVKMLSAAGFETRQKKEILFASKKR